MIKITTGARIRYPFFTASLTARRPQPAGIPEECFTLGDHIRKARIERGQYQPDLAKLFRVTTNTVTSWEMNHTEVWRKYYVVIEKYLGYMPEEFGLTDLAKKLVSYRFEHDLSIQELADIIGVDNTCVISAEKGSTNFQKSTWAKLNSFLSA